jgi:hypothetical protein
VTSDLESLPVTLDITRRARLCNQRLSGDRFKTPEEVVSWMGAVQAQLYPDAKWALALRMRHGTDRAIERALNAGAILRTHVMRPTWHFVAAADIRWMLALTGPRVSAKMQSYNRRLELNGAVFRRSQRAIERALRDGAELTRQELKIVLRRAGVRTDSVQRLAHLVIQAELEAVICSGARSGNQLTYALFDKRVPPASPFLRDEALAELTRRYFTSHGPAQIQDFMWWSGLTAADARAGLAMAERDLARDVMDGQTYWFSPAVRALTPPRAAYLLGLYDEYLIAYKDRRAALDLSQWRRIVSRDPFSAPIVVNGQVVGGWTKKVQPGGIVITLTPFTPVSRGDSRAIGEASRAYADFLGLDHELSWR